MHLATATTRPRRNCRDGLASQSRHIGWRAWQGNSAPRRPLTREVRQSDQNSNSASWLENVALGSVPRIAFEVRSRKFRASEA